VEIRTLRRAEREPWLGLLDHWDVGDGWRGEAFFRRYLEDDPTFADHQVWVAAEGADLLSCVQIFPRPLQTASGAVPLGGIGSVFTRPDARRRGLAGALLTRAAEDMAARGACVSMLFTGHIPWYTKLGWHSWGLQRVWLERAAEPSSPRRTFDLAPFDRALDLPSVRALHEAYSSLLPGTVVRDDALWEASLRNAGNPNEEFTVVRVGGECVAYLRAVVLSNVLVLSEFGSAPGFEEALAYAVRALMQPRDPDPMATGTKPSEELRRVASTVSLHFAPDLAAELLRSGITLGEHANPSCMLRCLDAPALGARIGLTPREDEPPADFLRRALPPEDFTFWTADRF
jgi:GNAT superfamily N-acetyltransferase